MKKVMVRLVGLREFMASSLLSFVEVYVCAKGGGQSKRMRRTLPAPAGPIIITPNLLMFAVVAGLLVKTAWMAGGGKKGM